MSSRSGYRCAVRVPVLDAGSRVMTSVVMTVLVMTVLATSACSAGRQAAPTGVTGTPVSSARHTVSTSASPGVGPLVSVTETSAAAPTFPAVVALSWLDGSSNQPAMRLAGQGFTRWQGSTPGEAAVLLPDGAYRWVGPDGSMVACGPRPAGGRGPCIGVDAAGDTAVTGRGSAVRVTYGPDGAWRGDFESNGARVSGPRPLTLAQAVAASGVDLPSLVDFATRRPPFAGGITGDPHLITAGGVRVTTQRLGDFEARTGDPAHQIQIRTEAMPYRTDVAEVTAAVVGASGHRVELRRTGELLVDGDQITSDGRFRQISVPGGVAVGWWAPDADGIVDAVVLWPDGAAISTAADSALGVTVVSQLPGAAVGGLFGFEQPGAHEAPSVVAVTSTPNVPDAGAAATRGDFAARSSAGPSIAALSIDQVVESWRVRAGESMFSDPAPSAVPQSARPPTSPSAALAAEKYCAAANMINPEDVASCVFDVARTGDTGYVAPHGEVATAAEAPGFPAALVAQWPALELGTVLAPVNLAVGAPIDVSVTAGDRRVYLLDIPAGATVTLRGAPCPAGGTGDQAPIEAAALRLFDGRGHPVSARRAACGRGSTDPLAAGSYYLVLAGAARGPAASFKVRVTAS